MMTILALSFLEVFFGLVGIAAGGFLRGFLGFGAALLIVPVLSLVMAPVEAIAILVLIELPNIVYLIPRSMRECELKTVAPMMCGLIIAVPLGTTLLVFVDPVKMKFVISIVLLGAIALLASGWRIKGKISRVTTFTAGAIGGGLQGAAGMGGPPLVTTLLSIEDDANTTRSNIIIALSTNSLMNAIAMLAYGKISFDLLQFSIVAAVLYVGATMFGAKFFRENGNEHFRKAALGLLTLIAILMLYSVFK